MFESKRMKILALAWVIATIKLFVLWLEGLSVLPL